MPPPEPRSRTVSPGRRPASAVGLPQPSDARSASGGRSATSWTAYKLDVIGSPHPEPDAVPPQQASPQQAAPPTAARRAAAAYLSRTTALSSSGIPSSRGPARRHARRRWVMESTPRTASLFRILSKYGGDCQALGARLLGHDGFRFDLHQHDGIHEPRDGDERASWADVAKDLAVRPPDGLPVGDVGHENSGAHDVREARAEAAQGAFDVLEHLDGLSVGVTRTDDPAVRVGRGRAGHLHSVSHADGA